MTVTALQHLARRAILTRLKAHAPLTALVPVASIDPVGTPEWPFITITSPRGIPRRMSCAKGGDLSFDIHAFAGPTATKTADKHIAEIGAAIESALAPNHLTLENGADCRISFSDMNILPDEDVQHRHWFGQLNCRALKALA